jgi:hypothetical protein
VWLYAAACATSRNITNIGLWVSLIIALSLTFILT